MDLDYDDDILALDPASIPAELDWERNGVLDPVDDPPDPPHRLPPGCAPEDLYAKDLARCAPLSRDEQTHYARLVHQGDPEAFRFMVECNLRLVARIARHYVISGIPLLDLIEEGNLGLIKAIQRFDSDRGIRFSTYAVHWICEHMGRAIRTQQRPVTLPSHAAKSLGKCLWATRLLEASLDHEPSPAEVAAAMRVPTSRVIQFLQLGRSAASLDGDGSADAEDEHIAESLAAPDPIAELVDGLTEEVLERRLVGWLDRLPERMREVICSRYGLDGRKPEKLKAIGARLGVTESRVQQMQVKALRALREMAAAEGLEIESELHVSNDVPRTKCNAGVNKKISDS